MANTEEAPATGPAFDYGAFSFASKEEVLAKAKEFWNPGKTQFWIDSGVPLVIDRREDYFLYDMSGKRLIDLHLNGGTYNLGHRNPEVVQAVTLAMQHFDVGNHHFPALARTALAEALITSAPQGLTKVIYGSGGGEAIDIALKTARHTTQKRKILSIVKAYHGHTGLAVATGDERFSTLFLSDRPEEFPNVPFNDLDAMEAALRGRDIAAVIMETIPATYGFPLPEPGYLESVKRLCEEYDALYIADEVMAGVGRAGDWFAFDAHDTAPDLITFAKGVNSGYVPLGGVVISAPIVETFSTQVYPGGLTYSGHPLACAAAVATIEAMESEGIIANAKSIGDDVLRPGLSALAEKHPVIGEVRGTGVFFALDLVKDRATKEELAPYGGTSEAMGALGAAMKAEGLFPFMNYHRLHIVPPCTISAEEASDALVRLDRAFDAIDSYYEGQ